MGRMLSPPAETGRLTADNVCRNPIGEAPHSFEPNQKIALTLAAISTIGLLTACNEPGSQGWCDTMSEKSKSEWTGSDTKTYAAHCVLESTTIGSEAWCDNLNETPKGEWTTEEVAEYAKYCVVSQISQ